MVAFDVNETLSSLQRLGSAFTAIGLDPASVPLRLAGLLRDGFALTAMGSYRPFGDLAATALRSPDPVALDDAAVAPVLAGFHELEPHPDIEEALRRSATRPSRRLR
jgi:2-haloacid dehalogenase